MKKRIRILDLSIILVALLSIMHITATFCLAENYPDKWYGWHCPLVDLAETEAPFSPPAFQDQKIIDAWGYKAKPVDEIKDLIPEGFYNIVKNPEIWGPIRINETAYIPKDQWPGEHIKRIREATKENKGTAHIDERGHIRDFISGIPFPGTEDPLEIGWNIMKSLNWGQELWVDLVTAIVGKKGDMRFSQTAFLNFYFTGRIMGDNIPSYVPNPNKYEILTAYLFRAPYDIRGMVNLNYRYDDPDKDDDSWMYIPALRRTRRMSTSQRWDRLPGGNDISYDNATGFHGKPTNYDWKYLGRKELLVGHNPGYEMQMLKNKPGGGVNDKQYQRVNTVVVEYIPRMIAPISKGVLYLDPESYVCYYCENYDKKGRLWIFFNHMWEPHQDGNVCPSSYLTADVQRGHTSSNYTYGVWQDEPAEKLKGVTPNFMTMKNLKKYLGGR